MTIDGPWISKLRCTLLVPLAYRQYLQQVTEVEDRAALEELVLRLDRLVAMAQEGDSDLVQHISR